MWIGSGFSGGGGWLDQNQGLIGGNGFRSEHDSAAYLFVPGNRKLYSIEQK